ncbi:MAG: MmcQ/YjbR family DNA-binding protein [Pseudomonadota bacterium]
MSPEAIKDHALAHPGACHVVQWRGSDVYKVGGKVFALVSHKRGQISVKCSDEAAAAFLIEIGVATRAPYLPRGGWVAFDLATSDAGDLQERISLSYRVVSMALPAELRQGLDGS